MRILLGILLLSTYPCLAQETPSGPPQPPKEPQEQVLADQPEQTITVPAETRVQLALANPIRTHNAHVGDTVRAATTFPVTVGSVLAIPQGTFVEGSIIKIGKRGSTRFDGLHIQFKQIVFTNGYNAALDGSVVEAKAMEPSTNSNGVNGTPGLLSNGLQQGPAPPQPPPLPQVGPPKGPIIGATLGGMAALVITGILLGRHHMHEQPHDFDTGFQFEVVLKTPLTLDGASVAAAVSASSVP